MTCGPTPKYHKVKSLHIGVVALGLAAYVGGKLIKRSKQSNQAHRSPRLRMQPRTLPRDNLTVKGRYLPEPMATPAPVSAHRPMRDRLAFTYMPDMAAGVLRARAL